MAYTQVADAIVPAVFTAYMQAITEVKSNFVRSGVLVRDPRLDALLVGGGKTFDMPFWNDLADVDANVSIGAAGTPAVPINITSHREIGVRLSRNQAWGSADLVSALAGDDPQRAIAERVAPYWVRQSQFALIATARGVFADNDANDAGDYTVNISGTAYVAGVTDFSAEAFIDAVHTMGDSEQDLGIVVMHSVVYARAKKNNLIDFVQESANGLAVQVPTFLGRRVIVDDGVPFTGTIFDTLIFGAGAFRWGVGSAKVPVETYRLPLDANGGGTEALVTRVEWIIHPMGHAYAGVAPDGGPSNANTANNLAAAASWDRRKPQRKMVKIARLRTREA